MTASKDLRSTLSPPPVYPLVSPKGRFVFSLMAANLRDGLVNLEKVNGEYTASLSKIGAARGYKTIEEVADSPDQAKELFEGLVASFGARRGASIPDDLVPRAVLAMREAKKTEKVPFKRSSTPKASPSAKNANTKDR